LSQVKQELNKTVKSYTRRFFVMRATIANNTDEDVIRCFQNGLFSTQPPDYYHGTARHDGTVG
jgi:hypothetical protein